MLINKRGIFYFALYLSYVYGSNYPRRIINEYENGIQLDRISSYVNDNINQYPCHDLGCRHREFRPYNFDKNSDYDRYAEEHYKQTIPELLQEIKSHIINLSAPRYQPFFVPWPVLFYPQKNAGGDLPNPTKPEIFHRYSEDDNTQNWGLDRSTDIDPKRIWTTDIKEDNDNATKTECNCEKAEVKTAPHFQQKYSVDASTRCRAAALYCCIPGNTKQQRGYCFESQGCLDSYKTGYACLPIVIRAVYAELYKDTLN